MNDHSDIIKEITSSPNRLRESYILKNYPEFHEVILNHIINNNLPTDITFKEKLWYLINNIKYKIVCEICGDSVNFNRNFKHGYKKFCSAKCTQQNPDTKLKRKLTTIKKYGVDNISKLEETKKKQEKTNINRYGHKSSFQNEKVRDKWKSNIKEKYGVDHIFKLEEVKKKSRKTTLEKYGVEHFVQSNDYKIILNNIGHSDNMKLVYNNKTRKTNLEKYGVEHFTQSDEYKKIMSDSNMISYLKNKRFDNMSNKISKLNGYELISTSRGRIEIKSIECGHIFEISTETFYQRYYNGHKCCLKCLPLNSISQSSLEINLHEFLDKYNIVYIKNDNKLGIELDVYIPSHSLSIEMNGLYWHSEMKKHRRYHLTKTNICKENGIELLHIWEDDWLYKKDIIKSIILNKLNIIPNKIYARKCGIKLVDTKEARRFLDNNHIQGYSNSKVKIGLYHEDILVSLMTFGERYINGKRETELIRFCNIINHSVIGSASKLFKYYINNFEFKTIKSYADISIFNGNLYKKLGFEYIHRTQPNYFWIIDGIRKHRFNYNKKKLISEGFDPDMSESEIMHQRGYYRVWGCGQDLYIYK